MIKTPSKYTLKKYGLSIQDWENLLISQNYCCPICERHFDETVHPVVDHFHISGYRKFPPEKKRKYIRGLLCIYDNLRVVSKSLTTKKAYNSWKYLKKFDKKINKN